MNEINNKKKQVYMETITLAAALAALTSDTTMASGNSVPFSVSESSAKKISLANLASVVGGLSIKTLTKTAVPTTIDGNVLLIRHSSWADLYFGASSNANKVLSQGTSGLTVTWTSGTFTVDPSNMTGTSCSYTTLI